MAALTHTMSAAAQETFWNFQYNMSFSLSDQKDYISDPSFRGWSMDGSGFVTDNIAIGGLFSWEVFHGIERDLPPQEVNPTSNISGSVSGVQYRYLNSIPLMVTAKYVMPEGTVRPYFGIGIGTNYVEQRTDIGLVSVLTETWRFGLQPEVGAFIPVGYGGGGFTLSAKYRYATTNGDDTFALNYFAFGVGFGYMR